MHELKRVQPPSWACRNMQTLSARRGRNVGRGTTPQLWAWDAGSRAVDTRIGNAAQQLMAARGGRRSDHTAALAGCYLYAAFKGASNAIASWLIEGLGRGAGESTPFEGVTVGANAGYGRKIYSRAVQPYSRTLDL